MLFYSISRYLSSYHPFLHEPNRPGKGKASNTTII